MSGVSEPRQVPQRGGLRVRSLRLPVLTQACDIGKLDYRCLYMNPNLPPTTTPPASGTAGTPVPKRRHWLLYLCGLMLVLLLVICATVAITVWYIQRPIQPVVLSVAEKAALDTKLERLGGKPGDAPRATIAESAATKPEPDRPYVPGSKVLRLTERELNGLLNANTDLGKTVRLELGRDAINAYVTAPIPADVPVVGGKMFRARGRFRVSLTNGAAPVAILEDVTVFGLSLPKEWLGGIKGENLLGEAMGEHNGTPILKGVKSLRIEPGAIELEVGD